MLSIRRPARRALDLGTGNGIQAILLSRTSDQVVATDLNPRALRYAALNAALNGVTHIEFREGDLFAPVEGERFDVAVANPPYVISPETTFTFRDSVLGGEAISARVVAGMADVLEEGGHATVLVSWNATGPDPHATPSAWVAGLPVDAVVLSTTIEGARSNAERWTAAHADREAAFAEWYGYYVANGIDLIGYAGVVLRRRAGPGRHRVLPVPPAMASQASEHLVRLLDGQEADVQAGSLVRLVPAVRVAEVTQPADETWALATAEISLADGLGFRADLDVPALAIVRALATPSLVSDLPGDDPDEVVGFVRELVELGFAERVR
jgi:SAM-dependent methyltransferase